MKAKQPPVSVIINTCDRARYLGDTLTGLLQQTYQNFEVIVVNGPSQDNTEEVARQFPVRYYTAPFNISVSRNIGIKHAAGHIVAFIDDDAVPSPTWLEEIVAGYTDSTIGAVGGWVYHVDKADYQFKFGAISKWGEPLLLPEKSVDYNQPHGGYYNINIGTNASYAREPLVSVGGFDEEIEYYHDESDVCVRLIDGGYKVRELQGAVVHHKMAPSSRRTSWQNVSNWDSVVKNGVYFALKHTQGTSLAKRLVKPFLLHKGKYKLIFLAFWHQQLAPWQCCYRLLSLTRAFIRGYWRGLFERQKLLSGYKYMPEQFKRYKGLAEGNSQAIHRVVLVSQGFPPAATDGIARYNHTLAKELARNGHEVHVVTRSTEGHEQVKYDSGYWVHYHNPDKHLKPLTGSDRLDSILALTKSVFRMTEKVAEEYGKLDLVVCPLWDVEGLALVVHKLAPTMLTLMSPLKKVVETQWRNIQDPSIETLYELERYTIEHADGVMAISNAIKKTIGKEYGIDWQKLQAPVCILPLGVDPQLVTGDISPTRKDANIKLLFVGRFERRKGIDLLLDVLPNLLKRYPELHARLIGNAEVTDENGVKIYDLFKRSNRGRAWLKRVRQDGYVTDAELAQAYKECDIFVAPSRYESFGLIFVEAMANGKPVVGTNVGGIPEIVHDGENGLLFELDNADDLERKLRTLIEDQELRLRMGSKGRKLIETKFNAHRMYKDFIAFADTLAPHPTEQ